MRFFTSSAGWAGLAAVLFALGCGPRAKPGVHAGDSFLHDLPPNADAPYELAEDTDLEVIRVEYDAMRPDQPSRADARTKLAAEYARRIDVQLAAKDHLSAYETMLELASLWRPADLQRPGAAAELAPYEDRVTRIKKHFARGGGDEQTVAALALLMEMHPKQRADHRAEVEMVFEYADNLSVAQHGPGGQRARPIEILEAIVEKFPSKFVVDELTRLYVERQKAVDSLFRRSQADHRLVLAHGKGLWYPTFNVVRVLALAGRIDEAQTAIQTITGVGDDAELRDLLRDAYRPNARVEDWLKLADSFIDTEHDADDRVAAFRIAVRGMSKFPDAAILYSYAGKLASEALDNVTLAIRLYERAFALAPNSTTANDLAGLYEERMGSLVFGDRPRAALNRLKELEAFHAKAANRWPGEPMSNDLADAYATMGRGLVSLGELDPAERYLKRSVELRPTLGALEHLGTIALKRDQFREAIAYFDKSLNIPADNLGDLFRRAKILRLASEAYIGRDNKGKAAEYAHAALMTWRTVQSKGQLQDRFQAEMYFEIGQLLWNVGKRENAFEAFEAAVDTDPDGASTHAGIVAFLVVRNLGDRALDTFHRALGSHGISEYFKVYMSLWVVADARRTGQEPDALAVEFLAGRTGHLWFDDLARFATGGLALERLKKRATTRARRAELMYYAAVLTDAARDPNEQRRLLQRVVDTDMVMFFEYDMAKQWLDRALGARENTSNGSKP